MPILEAPNIELGSAPRTPSVALSPSPSEISSASSPEPQNVQPTPLFRVLAMTPPDPVQPTGQEELERRLPGYRRIVIPRELTLIELLKQSSGVTTDEEVLRIREAKLRVVADRVGLRRLYVLAPRLRNLTLDGSAISSLRDLGIGLIHLKVLSVNRCGLTCLDGVWGLSALRELHAAGNRLRDLHPLAALQRLHTLNIANNPIEETRIWTLGVCGALRRITLAGTPIADSLTYRANVASVLPMLVYLDDRPLHLDADVDIDDIPLDGSSDSETDEAEAMINQPDTSRSSPLEPQPGPSNEDVFDQEDVEEKSACELSRILRRRPATTECGGVRPAKVTLPERPRTAVSRSADVPTRLEILNTLMDEEWRCSGSKLTSQGAVCGNLARALRRQTKCNQSDSSESELKIVEQKMNEACRELAAEIPRVPCVKDWIKFKQDTGIEIDIDFNERPKEGDSSAALEKLERIERETQERLNNTNSNVNGVQSSSLISTPYRMSSTAVFNDHEIWNEIQNLDVDTDVPEVVDDIFQNIQSHRVRRIDLL